MNYLDLMIEVASLLSPGYICEEVLEGGYLAQRVAEHFGVPEAQRVSLDCGLSGVVIVTAEVLGEGAPEDLRALAAVLIASFDYGDIWHGHREQAVRRARDRLTEHDPVA